MRPHPEDELARSREPMLCYDGELGWVDPDPDRFLASIGVTVTEMAGAIVYAMARDGDRRMVSFPRDSDWAVVRTCVDDAEARAKKKEGLERWARWVR